MKIHEWMTNGITSFFTKLATGVEILCLHSTPKLEEVNLEHLMQSHIPVCVITLVPCVFFYLLNFILAQFYTIFVLPTKSVHLFGNNAC